MRKSKLNITLDQDLIDFEESLLQTISRIQDGSVKWHTYKEAFE